MHTSFFEAFVLLHFMQMFKRCTVVSMFSLRFCIEKATVGVIIVSLPPAEDVLFLNTEHNAHHSYSVTHTHAHLNDGARKQHVLPTG